MRNDNPSSPPYSPAYGNALGSGATATTPLAIIPSRIPADAKTLVYDPNTWANIPSEVAPGTTVTIVYSARSQGSNTNADVGSDAKVIGSIMRQLIAALAADRVTGTLALVSMTASDIWITPVPGVSTINGRSYYYTFVCALNYLPES